MRETIYFNHDNGPIDVQIIDNPKSASFKAYCGNKSYVQATTFTNSLFKEQSASFHLDGDSHYVNIKLPWVGHKSSRVFIIFISETTQYITFSSKENDNGYKINPVLTHDGLNDVTVNIRYKFKFLDALADEINYSPTRINTILNNIKIELRDATAKAVTDYFLNKSDLCKGIQHYLPYDSYIKVTSRTITSELSEESISNKARMAGAAAQQIFDIKLKLLSDYASKGVFDMDSLKEILLLADSAYSTATQPPALQGAFGNDNKIKYIDG